MILAVAAGASALLLGVLAGGALVPLALALVLWGAAAVLRGLPRVLALLAAPIALAIAVPMKGIGLGAALAVLALMLSLVPLMAGLGAIRVRPRALAVLIAPWIGVLLLLPTPPGRILGASDLAVGAVICAAGAILVAVLPVAQLRRA